MFLFFFKQIKEEVFWICQKSERKTHKTNTRIEYHRQLLLRVRLRADDNVILKLKKIIIFKALLTTFKISFFKIFIHHLKHFCLIKLKDYLKFKCKRCKIWFLHVLHYKTSIWNTHNSNNSFFKSRKKNLFQSKLKK